MTNISLFQNGFEEFLDSGLDEESKGKHRVAVSNYHKALTQLCNLIILQKKGITETNYQAICTQLKTLGPEIASICPKLLGIHEVYIGAYAQERNLEDCIKIKKCYQGIC